MFFTLIRSSVRLSFSRSLNRLLRKKEKIVAEKKHEVVNLITAANAAYEVRERGEERDGKGERRKGREERERESVEVNVPTYVRIGMQHVNNLWPLPLSLPRNR